MARPLLPLTVLLLLAAPGLAQGYEPPRVGFDFTSDPDDREFTLAAGQTHVYNLAITVRPASDDDTVDLVVGFSDFRSVYPSAIAPLTEVAIRPVNGTGTGYLPVGIVSGFTARQTLSDVEAGQYLVRVTSTLDAAVSLGDHLSHLGFTARDPDQQSSTATASYPFTFHVEAPPNRAPRAAFSHSVAGFVASFDASPSTDPDGDTLEFAWSFGQLGTAEGTTASFTFPGAGPYTVTLTATDPDGLSDEDSATLTLGGSGSSGPPPSGEGPGSGAAPQAADTDADTFTDELETASGSDPNNRLSVPSDRDGDGRANESDNCPAAANADQADRDGDGLGDVCDLNDDDGPAGDPDGDGRASSADNCPGAANPDQLDLDGDRRGDACDTDIDGDGVLNEADAFPLDPSESRDTDRDLLGNNADRDDDNDLLPDAEEAEGGSDPLDRHDPPWLATGATALRVNGTNLVTWRAPTDDRLQRFLVWREASPYVLLATVPALGDERYEFLDAEPPGKARYHIQAQLDGMEALSFASADDRATNWVTASGAAVDGCGSLAKDTDRDGLCDALEREMGLDPSDADMDGDGLKDGDELLGSGGAPSLPTEADSDGDGRGDAQERREGSNPLAPDTVGTVEPKQGSGLPGWLWPTLIVAGAIVVAALILRGRRPA